MEKWGKNLNSSSVQDIEFLIRTGGEQRISNFMLLQLSYSELYFSDLSWPEFRKTDLEKAHFFSSMIQKINDSVNTIEVWGDGSEEKDLLGVVVTTISECFTTSSGDEHTL